MEKRVLLGGVSKSDLISITELLASALESVVIQEMLLFMELLHRMSTKTAAGQALIHFSHWSMVEQEKKNQSQVEAMQK